MSWFMAIFLGFIQGVTEFLPVSSSGHLAIFQAFGMEDIHARHLFFDVLLHMGTLVAVLIVYWQDMVEMFRAVISLFRGNRRGGGQAVEVSKMRLAMMLIIATLPLAIIIPFRGQVEALGNRPWFVGIMLLVTGCILYFSDKLVPGRKTEKNMTIKDSIVVGGLQAIAVLPGISRSGTTITGGLMTGFDRTFAVRFSFLLSVPGILGANIIVLFGSMSDVDWSLMPQYLVGVLVAAVTGFFAIKLVRILVKAGAFGKFAYYCWFVGIVAIVASFFVG